MLESALKLRSQLPWSKVLSILLVNVATFTWATNIVLGRWLRDDIGPLTISAGRYIIASLIFWMLLQRQPAEERHLGEDRWWLVGMALTGVVIFPPMLYLGLRFTTAANATLMIGLAPLTTGPITVAYAADPTTTVTSSTFGQTLRQAGALTGRQIELGAKIIF